MTTTTDSSTIQGELICPDLGLEGNPAVRCPTPTPLHRCFAGSVPASLETRHQATYCLSGAYLECDLRRAATRILARHETSGASITGFRIWANRLPPQARLTLIGSAGLIAVGLLVLSIQWSSSWAGAGPGDGGSAAPTVAAAPSAPVVAPNPTSTPGTAVLASPPPRPAASPATAIASPTTAPTPSATTPHLPSVTPEVKTHVVEAGDNLWTIATDNGITVEDLMRANGLVDRARLSVGQRLVIPTPAPRPSPTP